MLNRPRIVLLVRSPSCSGGRHLLWLDNLREALEILVPGEGVILVLLLLYGRQGVEREHGFRDANKNHTLDHGLSQSSD